MVCNFAILSNRGQARSRSDLTISNELGLFLLLIDVVEIVGGVFSRINLSKIIRVYFYLCVLPTQVQRVFLLDQLRHFYITLLVYVVVFTS